MTHKQKMLLKYFEELIISTDTVKVIENGWSGGHIYFLENHPVGICAKNFNAFLEALVKGDNHGTHRSNCIC